MMADCEQALFFAHRRLAKEELFWLVAFTEQKWLDGAQRALDLEMR